MHLLSETENLFAQLIVGPAATMQRQIDVALIPKGLFTLNAESARDAARASDAARGTRSGT